jgi:hypothetical protein
VPATEHEIACCMVATFERPIDVANALRNYSHTRFILDLLEAGSDALNGALRCRGVVQDLGTDTDIEKQLQNGFSFSYQDGSFTFTAIVNCLEEQIGIAEQFLQHYALGFLGTLGSGSVRACN